MIKVEVEEDIARPNKMIITLYYTTLDILYYVSINDEAQQLWLSLWHYCNTCYALTLQSSH